MEENSKQVCIQEVLEKRAITIKYNQLISALVLLVFFGMGIFVGWYGKDNSIMRAQRFGYNSAILDYPGAGLAQANKPFCYDGNGNYHRTKKVNNWNFQIAKDQSIPSIPKINDEQIFKRGKYQNGEQPAPQIKLKEE